MPHNFSRIDKQGSTSQHCNQCILFCIPNTQFSMYLKNYTSSQPVSRMSREDLEREFVNNVNVSTDKLYIINLLT